MEAYLDRASTNRYAEINCLIQQRNAMVGRADWWDGVGEHRDGSGMTGLQSECHDLTYSD